MNHVLNYIVYQKNYLLLFLGHSNSQSISVNYEPTVLYLVFNSFFFFWGGGQALLPVWTGIWMQIKLVKLGSVLNKSKALQGFVSNSFN